VLSLWICACGCLRNSPTGLHQAASNNRRWTPVLVVFTSRLLCNCYRTLLSVLARGVPGVRRTPSPEAEVFFSGARGPHHALRPRAPEVAKRPGPHPLGREASGTLLKVAKRPRPRSQLIIPRNGVIKTRLLDLIH
jgi:hypothetical protein